MVYETIDGLNKTIGETTAMAYSDFTVRKVKQAFGITTIEGPSFFPELEPIIPSQTLIEILLETIPLAVASPSERSPPQKNTIALSSS